MKVPVATWLALAGLALAPSQAAAVEPLDTFSARLGGYITQFDTKVRGDTTTDRGTEIDFDKDLDLAQGNAIAYLGLTWRPWNDHEFGLNYYQDDASSERQINRTFEFNGTTYTANSTIHSESAIDTYEASYVWWAANNENWAAGPRLGLAWYRFDLEIRLDRDANGNPVSGARRDSVSADLPVPTLGASWRWVPAGNEAWRVGADGGWFAANAGGLNADVWFGRIGVEWFPWENWGFSLDYTARKINGDADTSDFLGSLDFLDSGIRLGAVYRF